MTLYKYLTQPHVLDVVVKLIRAGVITNRGIIRDINMYEDYMSHPSPRKEQRYEDLTQEYRLHKETIRLKIKNLKQTVK